MSPFTMHSKKKSGEPEKRFVIGLDLGQAADYTALVVGEVGRQEEAGRDVPTLDVRWLERFPLGTSYVDQVRRVREIQTNSRELRSAPLVVDATGVGRPVVDLFRERGANPIPVTITSGDRETFDADTGYRGVPKRSLVAAVQVMFQNGRLRFAAGLPLLDVLLAELRAFEVRVTDAGNVTYLARSGAHDDLVLAVALAAHWASRSMPVWAPGDGYRSAGPPRRWMRRSGSVWRAERRHR